jgi:hypothetical protein
VQPLDLPPHQSLLSVLRGEDHLQLHGVELRS